MIAQTDASFVILENAGLFMAVDTKNIINLVSLIELSARLNDTYDRRFILNSALLSIMGKLKFLRACVLVPKSTSSLKIYLCKGIQQKGEIKAIELSNFKTLGSSSEAENQLIQLGFVYCLPVQYGGKLLAMIALGSRIDRTSPVIEEIKYAELVATITANALQNASNHKSLINAKQRVEQRNQLLTTMFEISRDFNSLLNREEIIKIMSYSLMGQLMVSRFALFLFEGDKIEVLVNRFDANPSSNVLNELKDLKKVVRVFELDTCCELEEYLLLVEARAVAPLVVSGTTKGFLIIGKKLGSGRLTVDNLQFIESLANTAILALENERLFREELEKKRIESEMQLALEIQKNLLPKAMPDIENYCIAAESRPSAHVGGDYFDIIMLSKKKYLVAIADVSGKGIPAALLMANVQAALRTLAPLVLDLKQVVARINKVLIDNTSPDKFVTFFIAVLNLEENTFEYINAGHNPPIISRQNGEVELLKQGGLILGFMESGQDYNSETIPIGSGDLIFLYTDGVTEAVNEKQEEYGFARLNKFVSENSGFTPAQININLKSELEGYSSMEHLRDDITVLIIKRTG